MGNSLHSNHITWFASPFSLPVCCLFYLLIAYILSLVFESFMYEHYICIIPPCFPLVQSLLFLCFHASLFLFCCFSFWRKYKNSLPIEVYCSFLLIVLQFLILGHTILKSKSWPPPLFLNLRTLRSLILVFHDSIKIVLQTLLTSKILTFKLPKSQLTHVKFKNMYKIFREHMKISEFKSFVCFSLN